MNPLTIGQVSHGAGVSTKTIRYYESIGLLGVPKRSDGGYRLYDARAVEELRFVQRARGLGFAIKDVSSLLALWRDGHRSSSEVKEMTLRHVADVERKIAELQGIRGTLLDLAERCHGDHRPDCPILDELGPHTESSEEI